MKRAYIILTYLIYLFACIKSHNHEYDSTAGYTLAINYHGTGDIATNVDTDLSLEIGIGSTHIPTEDITVFHDRYFHVIMISHDLELLFHVHPEDFGDIAQMSTDGRYNITANFPRAGEYIIGVDFVHEVNASFSQSVSLYSTVTVTGSPAQEDPTWEDVGVLTKTFKTYELSGDDRYVDHIDFTSNTDDNGYEVTFEPVSEDSEDDDVHIHSHKRDHAHHIIQDECTELRFHVKSPHGHDAMNLVPYLDAAFHLAAVHEDRETSYLFHLHGSEYESGGHHHKRSDHIDACGHHSSHGTPPASFGPTVTANFQFPFAGNWDLIGQIKVDDGSEHGSLIVMQFAVEVEEMMHDTEESETEDSSFLLISLFSFIFCFF